MTPCIRHCASQHCVVLLEEHTKLLFQPIVENGVLQLDDQGILLSLPDRAFRSQAQAPVSRGQY